MPTVDSSSDFDSWSPNIDAWGLWDGTVGLASGHCLIGRKSCVSKSRPPYDDCTFFMGVDDRGGCCRLKLNAHNQEGSDGQRVE